jgi:hypothetical protein
MEFNKIYNDSFSQTHSEIKAYIRDYLTSEEFSIYDYNTNSNDLLTNFYQEIKTDKFNVIEHFKNLYVEFETFKAKIPNDSIENSFRLKVLPSYNKYRDEKLFDDFSFEYLISEIAIFNAKVNTYRIFSNNYYLLEMIYKSKDYSRYEIKEYNQTLENTETYIYYHKKMYPETYSKSNIKLDLEPNSNNIFNEKYDNELKVKLKSFKEDEKHLILHALYNVIKNKKFDSKNMDLTEFLRVIRICQGIEDITLFDQNYTKKFYKSVSDGLLYSSSLHYRKKLKERTVAKLKELQVPEVMNYIDSL